MTPEEVFKIFNEQHRLFSPLDPEADETVVLHIDSTIEEWRDANDLVDWPTLYKVLNNEFNVNIAKEDWNNALNPPKLRRLRDVCNLISQHYVDYEIPTLKLFGKDCEKASMFRELKHGLEQKGVDVSNLTPSSKISLYLNSDYAAKLIVTVTHLARGEKIFDSFKPILKKKGFWNYINIFDKDRYIYPSGGVDTFRELTCALLKVR